MTSSDQRLSALIAEELIWGRAKHQALLRNDPQNFKHAIAELQRVQREISMMAPTQPPHSNRENEPHARSR